MLFGVTGSVNWGAVEQAYRSKRVGDRLKNFGVGREGAALVPIIPIFGVTDLPV